MGWRRGSPKGGTISLARRLAKARGNRKWGPAYYIRRAEERITARGRVVTKAKVEKELRETWVREAEKTSLDSGLGLIEGSQEPKSVFQKIKFRADLNPNRAISLSVNRKKTGQRMQTRAERRQRQLEWPGIPEEKMTKGQMDGRKKYYELGLDVRGVKAKPRGKLP